MGLRPHEQRILDQIEQALRACDPKSTGMLSMFTRLEAYERIPSEDRPLAVPTAQNAVANRSATRLPGLMSLQSGMSPGKLDRSNILTVLAINTLLVAFVLALVGRGRISPDVPRCLLNGVGWGGMSSDVVTETRAGSCGCGSRDQTSGPFAWFAAHRSGAPAGVRKRWSL